MLRGTLATLPDQASGIGFRSQTLIVIGDVVGLTARSDRTGWGEIADPEPAHAIGA